MSIYKEYELDDVLKRIRTKIKNSDERFKPSQVATEKDIKNFEDRYGIMLPIAYRRFISEIADGGGLIDNISYPDLIRAQGHGHEYKLLSLSEIKVDADKLNKPFPLKNYWVWEDEEEAIWDEKSAYYELFKATQNGNFALVDLGCAENHSLIVMGECMGEMWNFADVGAHSFLYPRRDFLSWFEYFLDNGNNFYNNAPDYTDYAHLNRS